MALTMTLEAIEDPQFHCGACQGQRPELKPEHREPMLKELRRRKGCEGETGYQFGTMVLDRCPGNFYSFWAEQVIHLWGLFNGRGLMPEAGGILDQDARLMEAFRVLDQKKQQMKPKEKAQP